MTAALATEALPCYHGGAFFDEVGADFRSLDRRHGIINADVLDAWFPPSPEVLAALRGDLEWLLRTSPPTQCEGLVEAICQARNLDPEHVAVGAGSSDLVFRALTRWLTPSSRVLLLDPTYGEYHHLFDHVIGCSVDRFMLEQRDGYHVDVDRLGARILATRPDLVVIVNPNNPTGQHIRRADLTAMLSRMPRATRFWIDEAYLDYLGAGESLEHFASASGNVVVCKSMSKVYALSGARAAYLCGPRSLVSELRRVTPPWAVGLVAQLAAVTALRDPAYYEARYAETHALRESLANGLRALGLRAMPGRTNSILCSLPTVATTAAEVVMWAREHHLFIRDISTMTAAPDHRVFRVAVKDGATNTRMVKILAEVLASAT
jgi:histidinol-phosphate/aromatic aminotransferase/cobyric acid decarboxylase-like protein